MTVTASFDGRVFVPDMAINLPIGQRVRIDIQAEPNPTTPNSGELLAALLQQPANPDWPTDGAAQHDHYLYGSAKRP